MGVVKNIDFETWPKQGDWLDKEVRVCYKYDTSKIHEGVIVRDDREEPFETIIFIPKEGRYVRATECQYS